MSDNKKRNKDIVDSIETNREQLNKVVDLCLEDKVSFRQILDAISAGKLEDLIANLEEEEVSNDEVEIKLNVQGVQLVKKANKVVEELGALMADAIGEFNKSVSRAFGVVEERPKTTCNSCDGECCERAGEMVEDHQSASGWRIAIEQLRARPQRRLWKLISYDLLHSDIDRVIVGNVTPDDGDLLKSRDGMTVNNPLEGCWYLMDANGWMLDICFEYEGVMYNTSLTGKDTEAFVIGSGAIGNEDESWRGVVLSMREAYVEKRPFTFDRLYFVSANTEQRKLLHNAKGVMISDMMNEIVPVHDWKRVHVYMNLDDPLELVRREEIEEYVIQGSSIAPASNCARAGEFVTRDGGVTWVNPNKDIADFSANHATLHEMAKLVTLATKKNVRAGHKDNGRYYLKVNGEFWTSTSSYLTVRDKLVGMVERECPPDYDPKLVINLSELDLDGWYEESDEDYDIEDHLDNLVKLHSQYAEIANSPIGDLEETVTGLQYEMKEVVRRSEHNGRLIGELALLHARQMDKIEEIQKFGVGECCEGDGVSESPSRVFHESADGFRKGFAKGLGMEENCLTVDSSQNLTDELRNTNKYTVVSSENKTHSVLAKRFAIYEGELHFYNTAVDEEGEPIASFSVGWDSVVKH